MITKPHYQQLEKKAGQVKSADFCVQDAGANQNSVLSWRRSAPGSHGTARVSIHAHATKPAASQPQWPACFAQDLGAVGCRGPFPFPSSTVFHGICWSSPIFKPPSSSWESNEPTQSQAKQLPSKGLASCSSRASKSMASPKMQPKKHLHS